MIDYTLPLDQLPDPLPIEPLTRPFDVTITPPGSKSITCRAYVLAALAQGESKLIRPLRADDTDLLLKALCTLGAEARWEDEDVYIKGVGGRFPRGGSVNLGDGGTPTRFMIACACLAAETVIVDGSKRMRERPIAEGVEMLRQLGAKIEYVEAEGRLPVRVTPSEKFVGGEIDIGQTQSSQFISALMLIAPSLVNGVVIRFGPVPTSETYVRLTIESLHDFRVKCRRNLTSRFRGAIRWINVPSHQIRSAACSVEVDASSALYWALATLAARKSKAFIQSLPVWSRQPDLGAIRALGDLGAIALPWELNGGDDGIGCESEEPRSRRSLSVRCEPFPDGSIAISVAACLAHRATILTGLRTLRVKETDRIAALANELRKVGCSVETGEDWIEITRTAALSGAVLPADRPEPRGATIGAHRGSAGAVPRQPDDNPIIIETYNDHRMAMAFAVLGLAAPNGRRLAIRNPACVAKSYPTFWKDFAKLYQ